MEYGSWPDGARCLVCQAEIKSVDGFQMTFRDGDVVTLHRRCVTRWKALSAEKISEKQFRKALFRTVIDQVGPLFAVWTDTGLQIFGPVRH